MKTLKIILVSLSIPAFFATSALAGDCGSCDKDEKKEAFVLQGSCGGGSCDKGDDKKEAFVLQGSCGGGSCDKDDDKKEA